MYFFFSFFLFKFATQRGKTVPEELVRAEDLSKYRQVASHVVSLLLWLLSVDFQSSMVRDIY